LNKTIRKGSWRDFSDLEGFSEVLSSFRKIFGLEGRERE